MASMSGLSLGWGRLRARQGGPRLGRRDSFSGAAADDGQDGVALDEEAAAGGWDLQSEVVLGCRKDSAQQS
eukprot:3704045-Rhodomonas_salina.2